MATYNYFVCLRAFSRYSQTLRSFFDEGPREVLEAYLGAKRPSAENSSVNVVRIELKPAWPGPGGPLTGGSGATSVAVSRLAPKWLARDPSSPDAAPSFLALNKITRPPSSAGAAA